MRVITLCSSVWNIMAGLQCNAIKYRYRNYLINEVKNQGHEKWLAYKERRQDLGLCVFSFPRFSEKCFNWTIFAAFSPVWTTSFPGSFPYLECGTGKDPGIGWSRASLHPGILGVINYRGLHNQEYQNQDDGETVCAKSTWIWF